MPTLPTQAVGAYSVNSGDRQEFIRRLSVRTVERVSGREVRGGFGWRVGRTRGYRAMARESEVSVMSHIEQLVGRQIELYGIRRRLEVEHREPASGPTEDPFPSGPCVVFSREHGSQGTQLAGMVGERLGWKVFDREIVEAVARHAHVREQLIESVEASARSHWRFPPKPRKTDEGLDPREYLYHLQQVVMALGHLGSVVILGRGAHYIVPESRCVRVRVVAPLAQRVQRVAEREGISLVEAERLIETVDGERAAFVHRAFGREIAAADGYDLVVNLGTVFLETAARVVLTLVREKLGAEVDAASCRT